MFIRSFWLSSCISVLLVLAIPSVSTGFQMLNPRGIAARRPSVLDKHSYPYLPRSSRRLPRYRTGPYSACSSSTPCFDVVLSMVLDGVVERKFPMTEEEALDFVDQYRVGGLNIESLVKTGRQAAATFLDNFGVDFTGLSSERYIIIGGDIPGVATFRPFILDRKGGYLLTMASYGEQVQFFNKRVDYAGWILKFTEDFNSTGTFTGIVPKDAFATIGSYVIRPCEGVPYGKCRNILNPANPSNPSLLRLKRAPSSPYSRITLARST